MISTKIRNLTPSPTLSLDAKVKQMQAQGISIVNLCLGEPDFATPRYIVEAAISALNEGFTHYTPTAGIMPLREAIAKKFLTDNGITYEANEIVVGVGGKQVLYNAFQVLCDPGDEVIIPTPTWSTFVEQVKLADATPILLPMTAPFKLTAKAVKSKITAKTKCLLLNSPSNPTGAMIDLEELKKIAELAMTHNFWVISDEMYEKLTYGPTHTSIASLNEEIRQHTITINGFSKAYAMTGWRIGYAAGPKEIITAMIDLQSQTTSNTCSITQKAALAAVTGDQNPIQEMKQAFIERRTYIIDALSTIPQLSFTEPEGAFYVFVSLEKALSKKYPTSQTWCQGLLEQEKIAVVPGEAFVSPGYFRLSYAASIPELESAITGIKKFVTQSTL